MSHNPYATQPRIAWNRLCDCPNTPHEHGCYSRYRWNQCRCEPCRHANSRREADRKGRRFKYDLDWVVTERLISGQPVDASHAEIDAAIIWLTDHGYSTRQIWRRFPIPITTRRITRARARARLEVAA